MLSYGLMTTSCSVSDLKKALITGDGRCQSDLVPLIIPCDFRDLLFEAKRFSLPRFVLYAELLPDHIRPASQHGDDERGGVAQTSFKHRHSQGD